MSGTGNELGVVEVGEAENEGGVVLAEGQEMAVSLPSNPSTGYGWQVAEGDESILQQIGEVEFHPPGEGDEAPLGKGGVERLRFKAVGPGQACLKLAYRRPWERGEPRQSYSLEVSVLGADASQD